MPSTPQPLHVTNTFRFHLAAPLPRVAPLFGPEGERCWGGSHWNPQFLHPQPAHDVEGAVFTVQRGPHKSVWVATVFDPAAGRMQYVAMIPDVVVSVIDVRLTESIASQTVSRSYVCPHRARARGERRCAGNGRVRSPERPRLAEGHSKLSCRSRPGAPMTLEPFVAPAKSSLAHLGYR